METTAEQLDKREEAIQAQESGTNGKAYGISAETLKLWKDPKNQAKPKKARKHVAKTAKATKTAKHAKAVTKGPRGGTTYPKGKKLLVVWLPTAFMSKLTATARKKDLSKAEFCRSAIAKFAGIKLEK